jgi:hypothetical protein
MEDKLSNKVGRPLKFKSLKDLEDKIADYLENTPKTEWTITGLAIALDTFRSVLCDYEEKDEYSNTIKKAKQMIENSYELDLKKHGRTGTIFALKNFNWKDKIEQELSNPDGNLKTITIIKTNGSKDNTST